MNKHQEKISMLLTSSILPALAILLAATLAIVTNINNDVQQAFAQDLTKSLSEKSASLIGYPCTCKM
jgi:predicted benzoate:H+ symporter BenE